MSLAALTASAIIGMSSIGVGLHNTAGNLGSSAASKQDDGRIELARLVGQTAGPSAAAVAAPAQAVPRLIVRGAEILTPDGLPIRIRGWNWGSINTAQPQDAPDNVIQGANFVRLPLSWYFGSGAQGTDCGTGQDSYDASAPGFIAQASLAALDQQVQWASDAHLWVDVMVRGGDCDFWTNPKVIPQYIQMWQFLADRYKNTAYIGSYSVLSEPHPPAGYGNGQVKQLYLKTIAAIQAIDNATPIIVGAATDYDIRNLNQVYMPGQTNIIYTFNFYEPGAYVKQVKKTQSMTGYPGWYLDSGDIHNFCNYPGRGQRIFLNRAFLNTLMGCATAFRNTYHVPIFVDQIGIRSVTPQSLKYVQDVLEILKIDHLGFTYWDYRSKYRGAHGYLDGDIGVLWQDKAGVYHPKPLWLSTISGFFQ